MDHRIQQNPTPTVELTPAQERALVALLAGQTVTAAAQAANVDRSTIYAWRNHSRAFQTAYHRGLRELHDRSRARLLAAADRAVGWVEAAVQERDLQTSSVLLRGLGLLNGQPVPTGGGDPEPRPRRARQRCAANRTNGHVEPTRSAPRCLPFRPPDDRNTPA